VIVILREAVSVAEVADEVAAAADISRVAVAEADAEVAALRLIETFNEPDSEIAVVEVLERDSEIVVEEASSAIADSPVRESMVNASAAASAITPPPRALESNETSTDPLSADDVTSVAPTVNWNSVAVDSVAEAAPAAPPS